AAQFRQAWPRITDDSNLPLYGFRRCKTIYLINLCFHKDEIAKLDHFIYQVGLCLEHESSARDRLGLKPSKTDSNVPYVEETITRGLVLQPRYLIQQ
ncbi:hypothetical protein B0O99DRAFT_482497, partial [Bisporella sp. PMI_857]